ncbi:MAG: sigma-70 family RNA polymerase sigma factor [Planctomycetaceae bacterium]
MGSVVSKSIFFIDDPAFAEGDLSELLFLPQGMSIYSDRLGDQEEIDGGGDFDRLTNLPLLSQDGETFLFRKMNYLKQQAASIADRYRDSKVPAAMQKKLERLLQDADSVRNHIAECNLRLVISISRRFSNSACDFDELMSEGNEILLKAITKFDFTRGFRFSTYATHSVQRHFFRLLQRRSRRNALELRGSADLLHEIPEAEEDALMAEWIREEHRVTNLIARMAERLDEREHQVILGRFGLGSDGAVRTLRELAAELQLSKERVRQLQIAAIEKLRDLFDDLSPDLAAT